MSDSLDLVSVYLGANVTDAHLVKNLLLEAGIDASVSEENEPLAGLTIVPPDVLVRRQDEARARAIVADYDRLQEERANRSDWVCPKCGAEVVGAFDLCDACGADRPGTEEPD